MAPTSGGRLGSVDRRHRPINRTASSIFENATNDVMQETTMPFLRARASIAIARISYGNSTRPSVRPSVTTRYYSKPR